MRRYRQWPATSAPASCAAFALAATIASLCVSCDRHLPLTPAPAPSTAAAATVPSSPCPTLADDFEGDAIAPFWLPGDHGEGLYAPGAVRTSDRYARAGRRAVEVTVHQGDIDQAGDGTTRVERADLDSGHYPLLGHDAWYAFAVLLPPEFPIIDERLVIGTCKQADVSRPIVAQRFRNGRHTLTVESQGRKQTFPLAPLELGKWTDVVYHVRYDTGDAGRVEVWLNGKREVDYTGPTAEPDHRNAFYHKIGLYRDRMARPMTAYFDDYRIGPTRAAVEAPPRR